MNNVILKEVDVMDLVAFLDRKNRKFQATLLADLEKTITNPAEYRLARKAVLDSSNNFLRLVIKTVFGEIEVE